MDKCRDTPVDDSNDGGRTRQRRQPSSLPELQVLQRDMQEYLMASLNFMQDVSRNLHLKQHHKAEMCELKHRQAQELALFKFQESQHHQKEA
ncbi:hypothetical protein P8452_57689 [Trifolium repens]|nr:hypothetical protein P8452_57689 [Trifolium repens]